MISFTTKDRAIAGTDGSMEYVPWSALCGDYQIIANGIKYPSKFQAVWNYPDGDFQLIAKSLTKVQFRRLWLHHVQLENVRTIAKAEGVAHPSIVASITSAQRKILKIVQKHATKTE